MSGSNEKVFNEFLSAEEAKKRTDFNRDAHEKTSLMEIDRAIESAIRRGDYRAFYYSEMPKNVFTLLQRSGYRVTNNSSQKDGECYEISWRNINKKEDERG
jgi:hypothetical protein